MSPLVSHSEGRVRIRHQHPISTPKPLNNISPQWKETERIERLSKHWWINTPALQTSAYSEYFLGNDSAFRFSQRCIFHLFDTVSALSLLIFSPLP